MKKIPILLFMFSANLIFSECYELNEADCLYWSAYCEWNDQTGQCQEIGGDGGGGDGSDDGPYQYATISESDGLRNGLDYRDGVVYYPIDGNPPYRSIVLTPGWGSNSSSISNWAEFYASHGFIAMRIGPNDEINDSHYQRGEGLIDAIGQIIVISCPGSPTPIKSGGINSTAKVALDSVKGQLETMLSGKCKLE